FGDRELELAETVRPHLANLYRLAGTAPKTTDACLTAREREVLRWVAAGKTNRDIASILGASPRTIEKHPERIYEKLGVETRTAPATAGPFGSASMRRGPLTASARTRPLSTWGLAVSALANVAAIWPPMTSVTAAAVPRYGTCCRSMPAMLFKSSIERCGDVP